MHFKLKLRDILESACIQQPDYREEILKNFMQSIPNSIPPAFSGNEFFDRVAESLCHALIPQDATAHPAVRFAVLLYHQNVDIMPWLGRYCRFLGISDADREHLVACPTCVQLEDRVVVVVTDWKDHYFVEACRVFNPPNKHSARGSAPSRSSCPPWTPGPQTNGRCSSASACCSRRQGSAPTLMSNSVCRKKCFVAHSRTSRSRTPAGGIPRWPGTIPSSFACGEHSFDPELVKDLRYNADWKAAWDEFQADGHRQTNRITPVFFEGDDDEWVDIQLKKFRGHGLVLTCCPHKPVGDNTVLDYLIDAAVPVAILPGKEDESIVELGEPTSWRTSVLKCRQKQGGPALTLLWDDPESVPRGLNTRPRLSAPALRGS